MRKKALFAVLSLALLLGGLELLLPWLVSAAVAASLHSLTGGKVISVQAAKTPAVLLLAGQFDSLQVKASDAKIDQLVFAELDLKLEKVVLSPQALYGQQKLELQAVQSIDLTAAVTQAELTRFLNTQVKGVQNANVQVGADKVTVSGDVDVGGLLKMHVSMDGKISGAGQQLKFVTETLQVGQQALLGKNTLGTAALAEIPFADLRKLPVPVQFSQVSMEEGRVFIHCVNY